MPDFHTISEVILYTEDVHGLSAFYRDSFDLAIVEGNPDAGFVKLDTTPALCLHAADTPVTSSRVPKFVFEVEDIEEARSHLADRNIELSAIRSPASGVQVCDGRDSDGHPFSIESVSETD